MNASVVVAKIGGSLLGQPSFVPRLKAWIEQFSLHNSPVHLVLVVGGGPLVEGLRTIDRVNAISDEVAHWTAIHLMNVNAELLMNWWPELPSTSSLAELRNRCTQAGVTILLAEEFLCEQEPNAPGTRLPRGWDVTSDSIAARIAIVLGANQLILLKSDSVSVAADLEENVAHGLVDSFFPRIAGQIGNVLIQTFGSS